MPYIKHIEVLSPKELKKIMKDRKYSEKQRYYAKNLLKIEKNLELAEQKEFLQSEFMFKSKYLDYKYELDFVEDEKRKKFLKKQINIAKSLNRDYKTMLVSLKDLED